MEMKENSSMFLYLHIEWNQLSKFEEDPHL